MFCFSLTSDGLPIAYTREELYDRVVQLRMEIKNDKQQLTELNILFSYVKKMMDSVAETSFLGRTNVNRHLFYQFAHTILYTMYYWLLATLLKYFNAL